MTREIKFRAWDGKRLIHVDCIDFAGSVVRRGEPSATLEQEEGCWPLEVLILEQYTGLKDKNGTEVYEGDIVRISGFVSAKGVVMYLSPSFILREQRSTSSYDYDLNQKGEYDDGRARFDYEQYFEVIGNIHEHKHLLNQGE